MEKIEKKKSKKVAIIVTISIVSVIAIAFLFFISYKTFSSFSKYVLTQATGQNTDEISKEILKKVNNYDIYIDDVGKILSIDNVKLEEETNGISIYEIKIKYELSSLSAPLGQNYSGSSLTGTFYIAYNPESEMWCKFAGKSASEVKRFIDNDKNWIK